MFKPAGGDKRHFSIFVITTLLFLSLAVGLALADRGQAWPYPVELAEESQKAIILYNKEEEVLILGTELKAEQETGVLEFIPFPSVPAVSPAQGDPFAALQGLIAKKRLAFVQISKGGSGAVPVELRFSGRIGIHDVTVIKLDGIKGFSQWVEGFFRKKGVPIKNDLSGVYKNAADYLRRGYNYFVFDYIPVKKEVGSFEPLVYRFRSKTLYYPLKTSNITGGTGAVELALILPGSLGLLTDRSDIRRLEELFGYEHLTWDLSSSSKAYPEELAAVYPAAGDFFKTGKIYLQVLRFYGEYKFKDDLLLDISNIAPYAYKHAIFHSDYGGFDPLWTEDRCELAEPLSPDEKKDVAEAYAQKRPEWFFPPELLRAIRDPATPAGGGGQ